MGDIKKLQQAQQLAERADSAMEIHGDVGSIRTGNKGSGSDGVIKARRRTASPQGGDHIDQAGGGAAAAAGKRPGAARSPAPPQPAARRGAAGVDAAHHGAGAAPAPGAQSMLEARLERGEAHLQAAAMIGHPATLAIATRVDHLRQALVEMGGASGEGSAASGSLQQLRERLPGLTATISRRLDGAQEQMVAANMRGGASPAEVARVTTLRRQVMLLGDLAAALRQLEGAK